ncbi:tRNA (5-methylaminomethyl-2-thiouridine)(34)-methyltransferase MnmD [Roseibium marinum]|uniref:tRNA U34 5-methylaminomethyl-2-thiouridine-forming methyltransferase MnmC n=1 Tax=Roseibium marinum TaxID=281252 RepID=A0A2S3UXA0_9HYPH|nr:tRNA (5-methylaminomethyl-2-thiouridine)(34)-methyltransferase MnmD [Roseibium marinum]POF32304.1 tRNA U34 5-methylaminomethyl-2-thiouridine-forming methyltransferase MnmC [Roseibium marinum]
MTTKAPDLEWLEGDVPRAQGFDDTYFSRAGGLEETRHVFLKGNDLPERFHGRKFFTIAEFGFGTGLNFLTTLTALRTVSDAPALTFLSFELYPMTDDQLRRALGAFPELTGLAQDLIAAWKPEPGWNRLSVDGAQLLVGIGDARTLIGELRTQGEQGGQEDIFIPPVDAWFLDGFSPAKNPDLWDADLLKAAASLTAGDGTLATYTAAGWVRRNLQTAGFAVEKTSGFAGKREMVIGRKV